ERSSPSSSSTSRPTAAWSCPRCCGRSWAAKLSRSAEAQAAPAPNGSADLSGASKQAPDNSGELSGASKQAPDNSGELSGASKQAPDNSGELSGASKQAPDNSGG